MCIIATGGFLGRLEPCIRHHFDDIFMYMPKVIPKWPQNAPKFTLICQKTSQSSRKPTPKRCPVPGPRPAPPIGDKSGRGHLWPQALIDVVEAFGLRNIRGLKTTYSESPTPLVIPAADRRRVGGSGGGALDPSKSNGKTNENQHVRFLAPPGPLI